MTNKVTQTNPQFEDLQNIVSGEDFLPERNDLFENLEPESHDLDSLHQSKDPVSKKDSRDNDQNYVEAFINNKMVSKVFPDIMNWLNILGNVFSFGSHALDLSDPVKAFSKKVGSFSTKSFMVATSVINIVERCYSRNFFSALGFFNDIIIAGTVDQQDTYLARGTASGTYNLGNSLADSVERKSFNSIEDHVASTFKAFGKFFKNLFSKNIIENFKDHKNGMWAIFGGLGSNIGALSWIFGAKPELPTIIRDVCGVMMDIEQLNPGHLKAGRKNFFWSGVALGVGTISDLFMRFVPDKAKDLLVPMTFIGDGLGRHLLRLDRNERELEEYKIQKKPITPEPKIEVYKEPKQDLHRAQEALLEMAA